MPDDPDLLTIGDFARAVGLPASALRHYDECGLLVPARTDASTGYRYYTPALEQRARLVALMREVGVPIDTMRLVLDEGPHSARGTLEDLADERDLQATRTRAVLTTVLATLDTASLPDATRVQLSGPALAAALRQVRVASDGDASSALSAVLVDVRGGDLDVVATNRHWMARRALPVTVRERGHARAVLRLPAVTELAERLDHAGVVDLALAGGSLTVDASDGAGPVETDARPFPSYRLVLEGLDVPTSTALVAREALASAVTGARRSVVTVSAGTRLEVAGTQLDAVSRGTPLTVGLRSALLLRAVASCVGERVLLAMSAPDRPVTLTSPDQTGYAALVMPTLEPA